MGNYSARRMSAEIEWRKGGENIEKREDESDKKGKIDERVPRVPNSRRFKK